MTQQIIFQRIPCEQCGKLHIDEGVWATKPHHTHACQFCGAVWRPARENTCGVEFIPGFKNETTKIEFMTWMMDFRTGRWIPDPPVKAGLERFFGVPLVEIPSNRCCDLSERECVLRGHMGTDAKRRVESTQPKSREYRELDLIVYSYDPDVEPSLAAMWRERIGA